MSAVDAHNHLDHPAFDADRPAVWARARAAGVTGAVIAAADPADWDRVQRTAVELGLAWVLGVHPWWTSDLDDATLDAHLARLVARPTPHGIGETGLDHHRAREVEARALQMRACREHLAIARERAVPVVLHCVRAYPALLRLCEADGLPEAGGMVHAWSGGADQVRRAVRLGLCVSIGGMVSRSRHVAEAAIAVPLEHLLLETDAPDQPFVPGDRGEPADLVAIATRVAALRGTDVDTLLEHTGRNARRLFPVLSCDPSSPR